VTASLRVGITGADGLIGWHLRCAFLAEKGIEVVPAGRPQFASAEALEAFVGECDAIVHLAGQNRGGQDEVYATNVGLAEQLVSACRARQVRPHLLFSNSTQSLGDSRYGVSKRKAAAVMAEWATAEGGRFTNFILPHVFGEHGRPFYNSVVHTFCYQIANREVPQIEADGNLQLLHASGVAAIVLQSIRAATVEPENGEWVSLLQPQGVAMKVSELLTQLTAFDESYRVQRTIPDLRTPIDLRLFNTYRARLYPQCFPVDLELHCDNRGSLFEAVREKNGGQTFLSTTHPGITRGNHYHYHKVERFLVVAGEAIIRVRRLFHTTVKEFHVSGARPQYVDMPTLHTHEITNVGDSDLLTMFWSHEVFDPGRSDTVWENVR